MAETDKDLNVNEQVVCYLHHVVVCTFRHCVHRRADVVNDAHNSRRVFALDQLADNFVVEIVDRLPFNAFSNVLFLHRKQQPYHTSLRCRSYKHRRRASKRVLVIFN